MFETELRCLKELLLFFQRTPRSNLIRWFSSTNSSSSLWSNRAKVPRGRRASCCKLPPFSRHSTPCLFYPNPCLTSPPLPASRPPSSTPPSAPTLFTPHSTKPKLSQSNSLPSTCKYSQRYVICRSTTNYSLHSFSAACGRMRDSFV